MATPTGICTCGNHQTHRRSFHELITDYNQSDFDLILESDFAKSNNLNISLPYDNLVRSINEGNTVLLESANQNNFHALNELAILLSFKWKVGETIRVKFLNTNSKLEGLVRKAATEWMKYANVIFSFVAENEKAEIRIEFAADNSYWSQVGTLCRIIKDSTQPTMHLGFSDITVNEDVIYGTILHEFGHVLGCIHEHQQTDSTMKWDKQKVVDYYAELGWNEAKTNHNILDKFPSEDLTNSDYDQDSIMHYFFPSELTLDGKGSKINLLLSQKDKDFMKFCYPYPLT